MTQFNTKIIKWESINPHKVHMEFEKNKKCHQKFSCVTFIILYRFYSNSQKVISKWKYFKIFFSKIKHKNAVFNNFRRVVKKTDYFRFLDSKTKA